jgi:hypothetical protein
MRALRACQLSANRVKPDARRYIMKLGLLVSNLPHIEESRPHYEAMLSLHEREPHKFVAFWRNLKRFIAH